MHRDFWGYCEGEDLAENNDSLTNNNNSLEKYSKPRINKWHIVGISNRLCCSVDDLQLILNKEKSPLRHKYDLLSRGTVNALTLDGHTPNMTSFTKLMHVVNTEMKDNGCPKWLPELTIEWFYEKHPDLKHRQHVPDYVIGEPLVKRERQDKALKTVCGLYLLYRANGLDGTDEEGDGVIREILCIHPPAHGHIRVHHIDNKNRILSGLAYKEGDIFTSTLYRASVEDSLRSAFLMLSTHRASPSILRGTFYRKSDLRGALASGVVLRCLKEEVHIKPRSILQKTLRKRRIVDKNTLSLSDIEIFHDKKPGSKTKPHINDKITQQLRALAPKPYLSWQDEEITALGKHAAFLKQSVIRSDGLNIK